jgi:hypothetical protein
MGQELTLRGLVSFGDTLEAVGEIIARQPGRRIGERITAAVTVADTAGHQIAAGESIFLYIEKN